MLFERSLSGAGKQLGDVNDPSYQMLMLAVADFRRAHTSSTDMSLRSRRFHGNNSFHLDADVQPANWFS